MTGWESIIDRKIREAMEQGEFENLSGQGEPIDLRENPFEEPDWRMAHRMLRNAGFAPAWIEERKDIEAEIQAARISLTRVWIVRKNAQNTTHATSAEARWSQAMNDFREKVNLLNRRIHIGNLKTPAVGFHRQRLDVDREIDLITS